MSPEPGAPYGVREPGAPYGVREPGARGVPRNGYQPGWEVLCVGGGEGCHLLICFYFILVLCLCGGDVYVMVYCVMVFVVVYCVMVLWWCVVWW